MSTPGARFDPAHPEHQRAVQLALAARQGTSSSRQTVVIAVVSAMLYFAAEGAGEGSGGLPWIAALLSVLALHEGGHALAMRVFGYRDLKVFFIPFFGAAASGKKVNAAAWQRAIVSLAGPLPGLAFGLGFASFAPLDEPFVGHFFDLAIVVNAFNLLPVMPLDGGRILDVLLFSRWPVARQIVAVLSALSLVALGVALGAWILGGLGVFMGLTAGHQRRVHGAARVLRDRARELGELKREAEALPEDLPETLIPSAIEAVNTELFPETNVDLTAARYANHIEILWQRAHQLVAPASPLATITLLAVYGVSLAVPLLLYLVVRVPA